MCLFHCEQRIGQLFRRLAITFNSWHKNEQRTKKGFQKSTSDNASRRRGTGRLTRGLLSQSSRETVRFNKITSKVSSSQLLNYDCHRLLLIIRSLFITTTERRRSAGEFMSCNGQKQVTEDLPPLAIQFLSCLSGRQWRRRNPSPDQHLQRKLSSFNNKNGRNLSKLN